MKSLLIMAVVALTIGSASDASAAGAAPLAPAHEWQHSGMFGTFDREQLRRGLQVYKEVCSGCHAMKRLSYRNLAALGFDDDNIDGFAAAYEVEDGPDEFGDMFMRPAKASDRFASPFPNEQAARAANGGAYPVDLSNIVKARAGESLFKGTKLRDYGSDYTYALLTGYLDPPPAGVEMMAGMYYNEYFPGHQIAMAPPLSDGLIVYEDGTEATVEMAAADVTAFLAWASDPNAEERKSLGVTVILYLFVLTLMLYAVKRRIWRKVKH